jgi:hypothetical protein
VKSPDEILKLLASVNLKGNSCDFFKLYIYLVLTENLLLRYHPLQEKSKIVDLWCKYLRNCSTQITSTDWRSYASKVFMLFNFIYILVLLHLFIFILKDCRNFILASVKTSDLCRELQKNNKYADYSFLLYIYCRSGTKHRTFYKT